MESIRQVIEFLGERPEQFVRLLEAHLRLSITALIAALLVFVPIGMLCSGARIGGTIIGALSTIRVVPSLALILLLYPWFGLGYTPAVIALTVLAGPPLLLNTHTGMRQVDPTVLEAATGLGMNGRQRFLRVQLPLALPVIIVGIRIAAVEIIASATLASLVGVRTFGQWIVTGISLLDSTYLFAGAISVMMLVLVAELMFTGLGYLVSPRHQNLPRRAPRP